MSNSPHAVASLPISGKPQASAPPSDEVPPFVCVSSTLRRLLLQAEITAPRLLFATIEGRSGTGKHLLAQTLHRFSDHAHLPFRRRDAREWLANEADAGSLSGTLYLDRVDLLAPLGQNLLLNLVKSLQSEAVPPSRFLLLVSTYSSLRQMASVDQFLPDLAFRLTAARFAIPPLCEHREDIAPIAQALIDRICRRYQQPTAVLASGALPRLLQHPWPGNVRELASVLESAILDSASGMIRPADLALHSPSEPTKPAASAWREPRPQTDIPGSFPSASADAEAADLTLDAAIHRHVLFVLELNHGNKLRAARQLNISRSTLYRLLSGESLATQKPPSR